MSVSIRGGSKSMLLRENVKFRSSQFKWLEMRLKLVFW